MPSFLPVVLMLMVSLISVTNANDDRSNKSEEYQNIIGTKNQALALENKLFPDDKDDITDFGHAVSISGNWAFVGSPGSLFAYHFDGTNWNRTQNILPNLTGTLPREADGFGVSVSLSGNRAVIGANYAFGNDLFSGAAYIFELENGKWVEKQKLVASDAGGSFLLGESVSLSGDRVLIGGTYNQRTFSGAAYIFEYDGLSWSETKKLVSGDATNGDLYGHQVLISDDFAFVSAPNVDGKGAVYVFNYHENDWTQTQKIISDNFSTNQSFGSSISRYENRLLIGSDASQTAYIFENETSWIQKDELVANDEFGDSKFGNFVFLSGNLAIIGAPQSFNEAGFPVGAVYTYFFNGLDWIEEQKLLTGHGRLSFFGRSISSSNGKIIVGAPEDTQFLGAPMKGSAYIFSKDIIFLSGFD